MLSKTFVTTPTHPNVDLAKYKNIFFSNDYEPDDVWAIDIFAKRLSALNHYPNITFCESSGEYPEYKVKLVRDHIRAGGYLHSCFNEEKQSIQIIEGSPHKGWCEIIPSEIKQELKKQADQQTKPPFSVEAFRASVMFLYNPTKEERLYIGTSIFTDLLLAVKFLQDPSAMLAETRCYPELTTLATAMEELCNNIDFTTFRDINGHFKLNIDFAGTGSVNFRDTIKLSRTKYGSLLNVTRDNFFNNILGAFSNAFYFEIYHSAKQMNSTNQAWPTLGRTLMDMDHKKLSSDDTDLMVKDILAYGNEWDKFVVDDCIDTITSPQLSQEIGMTPSALANTKQLFQALRTQVFESENKKSDDASGILNKLEVKESLAELSKSRTLLEATCYKAMGEIKPNEDFLRNFNPLLNMIVSQPQFCLADIIFMLALAHPEHAQACLQPSKVSFADSNSLFTQVSVADAKSNLWFWILDERAITKLGEELISLVKPSAIP